MDHIERRFWTPAEKKKWMTALFLGTVALYASRMAMPVTIATISKSREWTKTESGTILSSFFLGYMMSQVIGGYLSDNMGGEIVLLVSVTGWSVLTFLTPDMVTIFQFKENALLMTALGRVLIGIFQGVHFPCLASIIGKNIHASEKTFFSGVIAAGPAFGMLIIGSFGSIILKFFNWSLVHRATGILGLTWVVIIKYYMLDRRIPRPDNRTPKIVSESVPWSLLFKNAGFWSVLIAHYCHNNCTFVLMSWLPSYFHDKYPQAKGWVFNVVPYLISPVTSVAGGWFCERLLLRGWNVGTVRKIVEATSGLPMSLMIAVFALLDSYPASLVALLMAVASSGLHASGVFMNVHDIAPQYAGSVLGIVNTVGAVPGFIGVFIAGYLLEKWKSWTVVFMFTSIINVFGCLTFIVLGTGRPIVPVTVAGHII